MRHRVEGRKLKRTASHRKALLQSLTTSLLQHKRIRTTEAKAKEASRFAEAIITRAKHAYIAEKNGGTVDIHARRIVARDIHDGNVLRELFSEIAPKVSERPGGYTRVVKLGQRIGDGARIAILELVDYNMERDEQAARTRSKSTMSRAERVARSRAKQAPKPAPAQPAETPAPVAEAEVVEQSVPAAESGAEETPQMEGTAPTGEAPEAEEGSASQAQEEGQPE
jgi:large subunit ribosomal protein L17